jgi:hypothetical protein
MISAQQNGSWLQIRSATGRQEAHMEEVETNDDRQKRKEIKKKTQAKL